MRTIGPSLATLTRPTVHFTTDDRGLFFDRRQLHGHVDDRLLAIFDRDGLRVHRVGSAAYVHARTGDGRTIRWIFGVWPRRGPRPTFAADLDAYHAFLRWRGPLPERWRPREETRVAARASAWRRGRRRSALTGRFIGNLRWYQDPDGTPWPGYEHMPDGGRAPRAVAWWAQS